MSTSLLLAVLVAATPPASPTTNSPEPKTLAEACERLSKDDELKGTQAGLTLEARCKANDADKRLNEVYGLYRKRLRPNQKELLKQAQRAWLVFRKNWCEFISTAAEGGSAQPVVGLLCFAEVTEARVKELEALSNCEEGDISCP